MIPAPQQTQATDVTPRPKRKSNDEMIDLINAALDANRQTWQALINPIHLPNLEQTS